MIITEKPAVQIRKALSGDEDLAAPLVLEFFQEHFEKLGFPFSAESARKFMGYFTGALPGGVAVVAVQEGRMVGFLAGLITPWILDHNRLAFEEIAWFVSKLDRVGTVGIKLYVAAERVARDAGVVGMYMGSLDSGDAAVEQFYKRKGFKVIEKKWMKIL